jgi:Ca-activated chloride channel family protein
MFSNARTALIMATYLLAGALAGQQTRADGLIVIHNPPPLPHHHPFRPPHRFAPLEVKYHHVTVKITDRIAVTEVDQVFHTPNNQRLEGTYLFPVPPDGHLDSFSMDVNGRMTEAELLDAGKARQIYEDIVRRMRDPALLEYAGREAFKARIYPIEPRSDKRVKLRYTQLLTGDSGMLEYRYPLNTEKFSARPLESVSVTVELSGRREIGSLYSPSHPVEIERQGPKRAVAAYEANNVLPDTDFQLFFAPQRGDDLGLDLLACPGRTPGEDGWFLLLASPSAELEGRQAMEKDVVFVLDTSGSMADGNKIDQARRALRFCLRNLGPGDRFEVVPFATEARPLFRKLVPADREHLEQAETLVEGLKPIGGTAIEDALLTALQPAADQAREGRPYMVVFLTDGRPTIGSTDEEQILRRLGEAIGTRTVRVFCFGIGTDINTHLLDRITGETGAASQYVLPDENLELKLSSFYGKISEPVLADLRLEFSGAVRTTMLHPSPLPDLFKGEQLMVAGRYSGHGSAEVTLRGTVNGAPRRFTYRASFPRDEAGHDFIPRLWATRRVGFLLDQIRLHGESAELKQEVTMLARAHGIVTPYTAYLIIEDEDRRNVPLPARALRDLGYLEEEAGRMYREVNEEKSGYAAVGGAQAFDALKKAEQADAAPQAANRFASRGQAGGEAGKPDRVGRAVAGQEIRHAGGKTFYYNGDQWIDAGISARNTGKKIRVPFGSPDYFELLSRDPRAGQWLSLGPRVLLLIGDTVYEVIDN